MTSRASNPFSQVPRNAQGHFLLHFYAAVDRLLRYLARLDAAAGFTDLSSVERYPFLAGYRDEVQAVLPAKLQPGEVWSWWQTQIEAWELTTDAHLPIADVAKALDLDLRARIALFLPCLVEVDTRFGTLFTEIQSPLPYRRPCLETLGHMLTDDGWSGGMDAWSSCQPLMAAGLLEVSNPDAPRSEWLLRVPPVLWDLVQGRPTERPEPWARLHAPETFPQIEDLAMPEEQLHQLSQIPELLDRGQIRGVILRGMQGSERLETLGAIARSMGLGVVEVHVPAGPSEPDANQAPRTWPSLGPLCTMARSIPVFALDPGPGETVELPELQGYAQAVFVMLGFEGGVRGPVAERAVTLSLSLPNAHQRERIWRQALGGAEVEDLTALGQRYQLPAGYIRQAGAVAVAQAGLDGRSVVTVDDVHLATRSLNRQLLDTLATHVETSGDWHDLVVSDTTATKLVELEQRCHYREQLLDALGPAFTSNANRGVRALFTGSSGVGKTLAAKILASVLNMDLYRVDLSAIVNKYIGETEKNLHRVLSRAEELDVLLLLDEGDSLLGARTDVKSSNDRYANLETNYLLQRLENYQGVVVVTTNASQLIDKAFQRRIDVIINFVPPSAVERLAILRLHLPADCDIDDATLADISSRCTMTGGQIRNAALGATLLAVAEGKAVSQEHLEAAIETEFRKAGALSPLREDGRSYQHHGGIAAFKRSLGVR